MGREPHRAFRIGAALLIAAYLVQLATPLRLGADSMALLALAASAADGQGFVDHQGGRSHYPPGYPALVVLLERAGGATPVGLVALNLLAIALGIAASYYVLRRHLHLIRARARAVCLLSLLSYVLSKHAAFPLSDPAFFGAAMAALAVMVWAEHQIRRSLPRACLGAVGAALLCLAAVLLRTVGLALVPALGWLVARIGWSARSRLHRRYPGRLARHIDAAGVAVGAAVAAGGAVYASRSVYFAQALTLFDAFGAAEVLRWNVRNKLLELGEIALNVPLSVVPLPEQPKLAVWLLVGAAALGVVGLGAWRQRRFGAVEVFFLTYALILFLWLGREARFWLPVIPLLFGWVGVALRPLMRRAAARRALLLHLAWFALAGSAALVHNTRLTLAGEHFPRAYGIPELEGVYLEAYGAGPPVADPGGRGALALRLLHRYGGLGERNPAPAEAEEDGDDDEDERPPGLSGP